MPGRSEGKKRLCVGNQGRVEGGETMDGMYCIIEESIFNKKPTKTFKKKCLGCSKKKKETSSYSSKSLRITDIPEAKQKGNIHVRKDIENNKIQDAA